MKRKAWRIIALIFASILVVGGLSWAGLAWAEERQPPRGLRGEILALGSESLTLKTADGEVEVATTDETVVRVPGLKEASLADLSVGMFVLIETESQATEGLVARTIIVRPPRPLQSYLLRGTVTAVSDTEIQVETAEERRATLLIEEATRFWRPGEPPTSTVDLEVGDPLLALGAPRQAEGEERTLAARIVVAVSEEDLPKVAVEGTAVAITRQIIVVDGRRGERAITVLPRTKIWSAAGPVPSLGNIRPGTHLLALGQPTEMGQWIAGLIFVLGPNPAARPSLRGEVLAVDVEAGTLQVRTKRGDEVTVIAAERTRYRVPEVAEPGLADIQVGDQVRVVGHFEKGSKDRFLALGIGVVAPPEETSHP